MAFASVKLGFWRRSEEPAEDDEYATMPWPKAQEQWSATLAKEEVLSMLTTVTSAAVKRQEQAAPFGPKKKSLPPAAVAVEVIQYRGLSPCRLCNNRANGSREYICTFRAAGGEQLIFPEGFAHYVSEHNVAPGQEQLDMLQRAAGSIARKERVVESPMQQPTDMSEMKFLRKFGCHRSAFESKTPSEQQRLLEAAGYGNNATQETPPPAEGGTAIDGAVQDITIPSAEEAGTVYPVAQLAVAAADLPAGVDAERREAWLADDAFEAAFGMDRSQFATLKPWKQRQLSRVVFLH